MLRIASLRSNTTLRTLGLGATLVGLATLGLPATPAAASSTPVEQQLLRRMTQTRTNHDLRPYRVGGAISSVAREQARRMADSGVLYHNPRLTTEVTSWSHVGEGQDAITVHRAFMHSPAHRANVLSRSYTRVGVGAVVREGRVWVAEVFKTPAR